MQTQQILVTRIANAFDSRTDVDAWGRTMDGQKVQFRITGGRPYFFVEEQPEPDHRITRIVANGRTLRNQSLFQIFVDEPVSVRKVREEFDIHYEADIPYVDRIRYDCRIKNMVEIPTNKIVQINQITPIEDNYSVPIRWAVLDFEMDDKHGFPDPEQAKKKILSVACWDSYKDKYLMLMVGDIDKDTVLVKLKEQYGIDIELTVKVLPDESELLQMLFRWLQLVDPDIVTGWNFTGFDWKYLMNRTKNLGMRFDFRPYQEFDSMSGYNFLRQTAAVSLKLDYVAKDELGVGKIETGRTWEMWEGDRNLLAAYNLGDVYVTKEIIQKKNIVGFYTTLSRLAGCSLDYVSMSSFMVDAYLMHRLTGVAQLPSRGVMKSHRISAGAVVFQPTTGLKVNVGVVDNKTEYPSIMRSLNMSPETRILPGETYKDGDVYHAPSGNKYRKEPMGLIPLILEELIENRNAIKTKMKEHKMGSDEFKSLDDQQMALKVLANSFYGVMGNVDYKTGMSKFRLADGFIGEDITEIGRMHAEWNRDKMQEKFGLETLYGDTDSVMIQMTADDPIEQLLAVEAFLNSTFDDFADQFGCRDHHFFVVEAEKIYESFFQAGAKKRYAGVLLWKGKDLSDVDIEDKLDIKGFEVRRSSSAEFTRISQKKLLLMILQQVPWPKITEFIKDLVEEINSGRADQLIGTPGSIQRQNKDYKVIPIHVRAAAFSNDYLGRTFKPGDKPRWWYVTGVDGAPWTDVAALEWHEHPRDFGLQIDYQRMIQKILIGPLGPILDAAGRSWDEVYRGQRQANIDDFF